MKGRIWYTTCPIKVLQVDKLCLHHVLICQLFAFLEEAKVLVHLFIF